MITGTFTTPNGAVTTFHVVHQMGAVRPFDNLTINVQSYASEQAFLDGAGPMWNSPMTMPLTTLGPTLIDTVEAWLIADAESPFRDGVIVTDQGETLETAKARAWHRIKLARALAEQANFVCDGATYQANKEQIVGATLGAVVSKLYAQPFIQEWTLLDNSKKTLDADQMIAVGMTLLTGIGAIYETGRVLRTQLDAVETDTLAEVEAIVWPPA